MLVVEEKSTKIKSSRSDSSQGFHIQMPNGSKPKAHFRWKETLERLIAALLLIPGIPMIGILWVLIRLCTKGPGIYRQNRVGKDGKVFTMFKLRTMRIDAEFGRGAVWSAENDPRVTRLGRILRKLHMDELPQLINVVKGEMSLIGPRPERPEIVTNLAKQIPGYVDRLTVLPGVTGLAQINLPPDTSLDDVRRKLVLDKEYINDAGLWFDLRILMSTFVRMLGLPGVAAMYLFCLHRKEPNIDHLIPADAYQKDSLDFVSTSHDISPSHNNPTGNHNSQAHKHKNHNSQISHKQNTAKPR